MIVEPKVRGFICTTAHPVGCAINVKQQINYIITKKNNLDQSTNKQHSDSVANLPKKVLIIGASTGYGLASRIAASIGYGAQTIGVSFEKCASDKRTASPGWYNTAAFEIEAHKQGIYAKSINGDAFSNEIKQQTVELIKKDWQGGVDLIIYSLVSPRRQDPNSGTIYSSVLKPIGGKYKDKTVNVLSGEVTLIELEPASIDEIENTINVMGGYDWELWIDLLLKENLLANNVQTVAYSYVGPEMTHPIYRNGTIGKAKAHLEQTAKKLNDKLQMKIDGHAYVSVNKGLVTQASSAIPVVPLYISLLYKVMKAKGLHEGCIEQIWRLYSERLYANPKSITNNSDSGANDSNLSHSNSNFSNNDSNINSKFGNNHNSNQNFNQKSLLDNENRIRIDDFEMRRDVQQEVLDLWNKVNTDNLEAISDIKGYREEFYKLFGFSVPMVDYSKDVEVNIEIPSISSVF